MSGKRTDYPNKSGLNVEIFTEEISDNAFRVWATAYEPLEPTAIHRMMGNVAGRHAKAAGFKASRVSGPGGRYGDKPKDVNAVYYYSND